MATRTKKSGTKKLISKKSASVPAFGWRAKLTNKKVFMPLIAIVLFASIGSFFIFKSFAATPLLTGGDGEFTILTPTRILDTRTGNGGVNGPVGQTPVAVQITGKGGVPSGNVKSVVMNVTVTGPTSGSYLAVWPSGISRPNISNLNFNAGQTTANQVTVNVGADGKVLLYNGSGTTHVIFDVAGYYSTAAGNRGLRFRNTNLERMVDSRSGVGGVNGPVRQIPVSAKVLSDQITTAKAVVLNVTVTGATASSYLTVWSAGEARPNASNLNYVPGQTIANQVTVKLGPSRTVQLYNGAGTAHVIIDVAGYYYASTSDTDQAGRYVSIRPTRILDTRTSTGTNVAACDPGDYTYSGSDYPQGSPVRAPSRPTQQLERTPCSIQFGYRFQSSAPSGYRPSASVMNMTVTGPTSPGYIRLTTDNGTNQHSNINFNTGQTIPNAVTPNVISGASPAGGDNAATKLYLSNGRANVIVDLFGYFL